MHSGAEAFWFDIFLIPSYTSSTVTLIFSCFLILLICCLKLPIPLDQSKPYFSTFHDLQKLVASSASSALVCPMFSLDPRKNFSLFCSVMKLSPSVCLFSTFSSALNSLQSCLAVEHLSDEILLSLTPPLSCNYLYHFSHCWVCVSHLTTKQCSYWDTNSR